LNGTVQFCGFNVNATCLKLGVLPFREITPVLRLSALDFTDEVRFFCPSKAGRLSGGAIFACFPGSLERRQARIARMGIKKQEFYEGAALHLLARTGAIASIRYEAPFFLLNGNLLVYLKYSARGRSPWSFTFMPDEQVLLRSKASRSRIVIGLICGADGVAAVNYDAYLSVAALRKSAIHVACYRRHGEHYEVNGPDGMLGKKIAPSNWRRILED